MKETNSVALYTVSNDNYAEITAVMIYSFLYNNRWFDGDIVIICDNGERCGLSAANRSWFSSLYEKVLFYEVNPRDYDKVVLHANEMGRNILYSMLFYKMEIFRKFKYDQIVFLDSDVVVNKDIKELFYNNDTSVIVVEDGFKPLSNYFNSGVMSIPMNYIDDDMFDKMVNLSETYSEKSFTNICSNRGVSMDQDIINEIIKNVRFVGSEYNFSPYYCKGDINMVKIFHYYGGAKPWLEHCEFFDGYLPYYRYYYAITHNFKRK